MISNSGHDERGKYTGGVAGDQSKTEWYIRDWYNYSWDVILRHPDAKVREMIATLAEESANNNHIGYDQLERYTYWRALKNSGYRPKNITTDCEGDCSAGVSGNVKATGYLLNIEELKNISENNTTRTLKKALKSAGFSALTAKKYLTSDKYLLRGDIILREGHHVCTNLTDGSGITKSTTTPTKNTTTTTTATTTTTIKADKTYIKKAQDGLNKFVGNYITKLAVDGDIGAKTRNATAKALQYALNRDYGARLDIDGDIGEKTIGAIKGHSVKKGSKSYLVTWLEIALMLLGYYTSSIEIAGHFGNGLDTAVRNFQKDNGLNVDGSAGEKTINVILSKLRLI